MELSDNDRQRIEQEADRYAFVECNQTYAENLGFIKGAEYATIYEREQQAKKGFEFGEYGRMKTRIDNLEAERSELRNKVIDECIYALHRADITAARSILNSLKTK